jgi:23S rRNA (guanosine2251-2'-O)-methyltransferase
LSLIYGFHPVRELLRSRPQEARRVLCAAKPGKRLLEIEDLCRRHGVPCERVPSAQLDALAAAGVHNGFVAEQAEETSSRPEREADAELYVLVEDIQDPRNLGALLRVCEGAGVAKVLIRDRGSASITPAVAKTAAGALEWLDVERITNSARAIEELKRDGFWVYGAAAEGDAPWRVDLQGKVLLCIGGESEGLRALTRERCDRLIGLPMRGRVESLNLATAAAALLYEAVRQRSER